MTGPSVLVFVVVAAASALAACRPADRPDAADVPSPARGDSAAAGVVEVTARDYAFEAPNEIPSGWTTFRMRNAGREHHFLLLSRLPAGTTFEAYGREVGTAFDSVMRGIAAGALDKAAAGELLGRLLPPWYASVEQMGGPGLVAPDRVGRTSVRLDPGTYVMECYVKTPDGRFHASLGMARPIVVTTASSGAPAPSSDLQVALSNDRIAAPETITAREHTVAVRYDEHPELGLGNDIHLVRLDEQTSVQDVMEWMDWMEVDGLRAPAPAEFLGGAQEMPAGSTAYFTVDVEPGRYAWISETDPRRGMAREVTVE